MLKKELEELNESNIIIDNINNNKKWYVIIKGSKNTNYENGIFKLCIILNDLYPFKPPKIKFITKIFHPNVSNDGHICLDILNRKWNPVLTIYKVLLSIISLLSEPNFDDPLNIEASKLYQLDKKQYQLKIKEYINIYCKNNI